MNYAYSALMANTCLSNAKNKITQNVSIFVTMATKQWNRQQFYKQNDIFKSNYLLTAQVYMNNA